MTGRISILAILTLLMVMLSVHTSGQKSVTKEILWTTDWSPDGKLIAAGGNTDTLKIYETGNLNTYRSFPVKKTITRVKWHPSMNMIAVATQLSDEKSFILSLETNGKVVLNSISPDGARGIAWNGTGDCLAVADNDGQILIYDKEGNLLKKFTNENTKGITAIDWHPKKNILTTVSDKIRFFDVDGNLLKSIRHRQEEVLLLCIAWHKSGDFFVTGDYGDEKDKSLLQYWNERGELIKTIDISKGEYRNLAWNRKGNRLASASDALRIWDTDGNLISAGNPKDHLWGVSWNKKGNRLVTSGKEQSIILWNKKAQRILTLE